MNSKYKPHYKKRTIFNIAFAAIFLIALTISILAREDGITGKTSSTVAGCTCHSSSASTSTTLSVTSGSGSFSVAPSSQTSFTVTVSNSSKLAAGVNIAVKTTETGETNAGTLSAGSGLQVSSGELTHTQPKAMSGGSADFSFTWTAPSTPGVYYLRAIGNAVNNDGDNDNGDLWNRMSVQQITVKGIELAKPNGTEEWCAGSDQNITWSATGVSNVKIELSSDGGSTFPTVIAQNVNAGSGSYSWSIPSAQTAGTQYKVRISDQSDATINDVSASNFTISTGNVSITAQPQDKSACTGTSTEFSVAATGATSYQWRKNGSNIAGATNSTYTINPVQSSSAGSYDVLVFGSCGDPDTSSTAALSVTQAPAISQQPVSTGGCIGDTVSLSVAAEGDGITYQWKKNGTNITGATSSSLTLPSLKTSDNGAYTVEIKGTCPGTITSDPAFVSVDEPHSITVQPADASVCEGGTHALFVTASGTSLQYQWRKDGANLSGATNDTLRLQNISSANAGEYDVIISGPCGDNITSQKAEITILAKPSITEHPQSSEIQEGANLTLSVTATGENLTYQWKKDGSNISNGTSATYAITNATSNSTGSYTVDVSNSCTTVTSNAAVITVTGASGGPFISLGTTKVTFDTLAVNETSTETLDALIKNTGDEELSITNISLEGANSSEFELGAVTLPLTLQPDEEAGLEISFKPVQSGEKVATLNFTSNATNSPVLQLAGYAWREDIQLSAEEIQFDETKEGEQSTFEFTISNGSSTGFDVESLYITGDEEFTLDNVTLPITVAAGSNESINIVFNPTAAGTYEANLVIKASGHEAVSVPIMATATGSSVFEEMLSGEPIIFPNPASNNVNLVLNIKAQSTIYVNVFDMNGNRVKSFEPITHGAGKYILGWDGTDNSGNEISGGNYRVTISMKGEVISLPLNYIK